MAGVSSQQQSRQTFFYDYGRRPQRGPDGLAGSYLPSKGLYNAINKLSPKSVSKDQNFNGRERKGPNRASDKSSAAFDAIKKRLKAAAYSNGKLDLGHLFRFYDKDNSGCIDWEEFRAAIRKSAKITTSQLSDKDLRLLFDSVDIDGDGEVDYMVEFLPWLVDEDKGSSHTTSAQDLYEPSKRNDRKPAARSNRPADGSSGGGIEQQQALAAQELFARMDVNKTGTLTFKDFERGLQRRSLAQPFAQVLRKEAGLAPDGRRSLRKSLSEVEDPLNLQAPPTMGDAGLEEDDYEMLLADGDYEATGLNPDSTIAHVESLLAQEKLLGEQTKWWEERLKSEAASRKAFQAEMRAQDAQFSKEVRDLEGLISELRSEHAEAEDRAHFLVCEAKDYENESVVASREVALLKPKIAELRKSIFPSPRSVTSKGYSPSPTSPPRGTLSSEKQEYAAGRLSKSASSNTVKSAVAEANLVEITTANPAATPSQSQRSATVSGAPTPGESAKTPKSEQGSSRSIRETSLPASQASRDRSPIEEPLGSEAFDVNDMFGGGNKTPSSKQSSPKMDVGSSTPRSRSVVNSNKLSVSATGAERESVDFDFLGASSGDAAAPKAVVAGGGKASAFSADPMDFAEFTSGAAPAPKAPPPAPGNAGAMPFMDSDMLGMDGMDIMDFK